MEIPRGLTAKQFFEEFLPSTYAQLWAARAPAGGAGPADDLAVRVVLMGDGGGQWELRTNGPELRVGPPGAGEAPITVVQSVEDWAALAFGPDDPSAPDAVVLAPQGSTPLDALLDGATRRLLTGVKGTLRFEVTGYEGRTWQMLLKLGPQPLPAQPDAVITMAAVDYAAVNAGKLNPAEAFFNGKVRLVGNSGLAMQLGMALMPRFTAKR